MRRKFGDVSVGAYAENDFAFRFPACGNAERLSAVKRKADDGIAGNGFEFFHEGIRYIKPVFKLFGSIAVLPFFRAGFVRVFYSDEDITGHGLNGYYFSYLFDGECLADSVLRLGDKPLVVHELSAGIEMFLVFVAAEGVEIGEIFIGRKFDFVVRIYVPMPFAHFAAFDSFCDVVVVAVQGQGDDAAGSFNELFSVYDGVAHNDDLL